MGLEIPGYKILRTLGRGGMATVYLAQQDIFERKVALKVMSKALAADESFGKRFFREAKIVSQLVHPNIVTVHDVGVHENNYYLSMEYIDGNDLKHIRKNLTLRQKLQVIVDIAKALDYAGKKGFVHRDIKPENIMFHKSDGRAVLTDFGIAKAAETDTAMTQAGTAIGTPHYMSPEQAKGKMVDHRSDIYSLGVVFFLLLAGRVPFDAESAVAIGIKHITEPVPLLPEGLDALQPLLDTLLAKKPENRYQHAGDLVEDISMINVELLEQSYRYASQQPTEEVDCDSPTEKNRALSAADLAVAYDDRDTIINEPTSLMSWFVGSLIVFSLVGWLLYYQKPEWVTPWLQKSKAWIEEAVEQINGDKTDAVLRSRLPGDGAKKVERDPPGVLERSADSVAVSSSTSVQKSRAERLATPAPAAEAKAKSPSASAVTSAAKSIAPKSIPEPSVQPPALTAAAYRQKLDALQNLYGQDSTYLVELVEWHRRFLRDYPSDRDAKRSLSDLRVREVAAVAALVEQEKYDPAQKKIRQLRVLFPQAPARQLAQMETRIARAKEIASLLASAQTHQQQGRYTLPQGRNAAETYLRILALSSADAAAKNGLQAALGKTLAVARKHYDRAQYQKAEAMTARILELDSTHRAAKTLHGRAQQQLAYQAQIDTWFTLASRSARGHHYFTPAKNNAYYYYQQILNREPGNTQAITAQKRVVDEFARNIWRLVGDEEFKEADMQVRAALQQLPKNQRLQSLAAAVNEVLADKLIQ